MCVHARLQHVTRYQILKKQEEEESRRRMMKVDLSDALFAAACRSYDDSDGDEYGCDDEYGSHFYGDDYSSDYGGFDD